MKRFRVLVLLLLVLAVPSYGFAALGALVKPCPMQMDGASQGAESGMADDMDCCAEPALQALACKACNACQDCHAASLVLPSADHRVAPPRGESLALVMEAYATGSTHAAAVWRPPRHL